MGHFRRDGLTWGASVTLGPLGRYAIPPMCSPFKSPVNPLHNHSEGWWDPSLPGSCEGTSSAMVGIDAPYPGLEEPSKDARKAGPIFVHPNVFHRIYLDLDS